MTSNLEDVPNVFKSLASENQLSLICQSAKKVKMVAAALDAEFFWVRFLGLSYIGGQMKRSQWFLLALQSENPHEPMRLFFL